MGSTHSATGSLAGAALLPDIDHPASTATRSAGPVTAVLSRCVRAASSAAWRATRAPGDDGGYRDGTGAHRHLTHTLPAAVVCGLAAGVAALHWVGAAVVVWVLLSLAICGAEACTPARGRLDWGTRALVSAAGAGVVMALAQPHPALLGVLVAAGMVVHVLGDWLTPAGVPLAWPLCHRGRRWWMWRSPVAFKTGDCWQETAVRWACWSGTPLVAALTVT